MRAHGVFEGHLIEAFIFIANVCFMHRYYILAPLSLFPRAEEFLVKTSRGLKSCRREEFHISMEAWKPFLEIGWLYWLGGTMFIWGWIHQSRCHMILVSLDEHKKIFVPY